MTIGKWWVVWSGKNVGVTHAARKPKGIAQGPFPSKIAAFRAGRRALLRFRVSGKLPNPPKARGRLSPTKRRRLNRMEFFQKFAGHIVGQRAQNALDLARAEEYAEKRGWRWQEIPEQERYEDVYGEPGDPRAEYVTVVLTDGENGPVLASLGFVDFNDADYVRVVRAELALEAMLNKRNPGKKRLKLSGRMKTVSTRPSPADNLAWFPNDVGTYIDGALGVDHALDRMHDLLVATAKRIREEDEAITKLLMEVDVRPGPVSSMGLVDEAKDEWLEEATRALEAHTADGLVWQWDAGDLILVNASQVLDNPRRPTRAARRFISSKIQRLAHEGMAAPRRIGAAYNIARKHGFKVPRTNPPLRDFKSLAPHQAEITHGNLRIFYSYDTPVALIDSYYGAFRTTTKHSKTTARHLFAWLRKNGYEPGRVEAVAQDVIDMAAMTGGIRYAKDEARARELDNPTRRSL